MLPSNIIILKWTSVLLEFQMRMDGEEYLSVCDVACKIKPKLSGSLFFTKQIGSSFHRLASVQKYMY